ncbi:MAG: hypothetical protein HYW69_02725, partial [Candidatus Nealsonbacteria bacterium]|nr:hypothetical protein [Candidatus Nealsonbacteria bacterium]
NKVNGDFSGYAWSDKILGWINFKGTDYKVKTSLNFNSPPGKPSASEVSWNRCAFKGKAVPTFSWTYSDPDSDPQAAYEIEVDDNSGFNSPKFNHLVNSPSTSYVLDLSQDDDLPDPGGDWISELTWNTTYFWHVRVKDNQGNWSEWSNSSQLKTNKHASPWVVFSYTPTEPTTGETVEFDSSGTESFGGALSYLWTILSGTGVFVDGTNNAVPSPHVRFSTLNNTVRLEATDSDGYACSKDKDVIVQYPLPEYKEVPPVIWFKKIFASVGNLINSFWQ